MFLSLQGFVFRYGSNTAFYAEGNDVIVCMVVGRKFFVSVFRQDKYNHRTEVRMANGDKFLFVY